MNALVAFVDNHFSYPFTISLSLNSEQD